MTPARAAERILAACEAASQGHGAPRIDVADLVAVARAVLDAEGRHLTDGRPCWCEPVVEEHGEGDVIIHRDWRTEGH